MTMSFDRRSLHFSRSSLPQLLFAALLLLFPTACSSNGMNQEEESYKEIKVFNRSHFIMQLKPGGEETDQHVGYLKEKLIRRGAQETLAFSVCNRSWQELGFYFSDGETFRFKSKHTAEYEKIGLFENQVSMQQLLGIKGPFRLRSITSR